MRLDWVAELFEMLWHEFVVQLMLVDEPPFAVGSGSGWVLPNDSINYKKRYTHTHRLVNTFARIQIKDYNAINVLYYLWYFATANVSALLPLARFLARIRC